MTLQQQIVFRRPRGHSKRKRVQKLWIWFVVLLACGCVALFMLSFAWEDSSSRESSVTKPFTPPPPSAPPAYDFHAPSIAGSSFKSAGKVEPVDDKLLTGLDAKFGPQNSGAFPLKGADQNDALSVVPLQSARPGR